MKINAAISKTRAYFESLGVKTHLSDYGIKRGELEQVIDGLKAKGMTNLSETRDLSLDLIRTILDKSF
jgi:NADP-dependent alcohol dehydrogenase